MGNWRVSTLQPTDTLCSAARETLVATSHNIPTGNVQQTQWKVNSTVRNYQLIPRGACGSPNSCTYRGFLLFLTFGHGHVSIVQHSRLLTVYSVPLVPGYGRSLPIHPLIPGYELQNQLPAPPHIASSLFTDFPPADARETWAFRREPSCDEELHRIFVVPLSSKNNQLARVWAHLCISAECRYMAQAFVCFLPRGAVVSL